MDVTSILWDAYTQNYLTWITAAIVVVSAIIMVALERHIPYAKGQRLFREGFVDDFLWYAIAQSYVLGLVIFGLLHLVDDYTGIHRLGLIRSWPIGAQLMAFLVTHDFYIYWFHRFQHSNSMFWRTHEAHHSTRDVDWLSGSRSHSIEILINQTIEFAPIVLLASPEVAVLKGCVDAVWGMYIHSNIDVQSGWLQYVVNGPEMHRWHHAVDHEAYNKNFSTKFAVWDWVFGTAYRPKNRKPSSYGLDDGFPKGYVKQHLHVFRPWTNE